jgi:hypothetical protein
MRFTKTPEELAARRARVSSLHKEGRVENDAIRNAKRKEQKRFQTLEDKADLIIQGLIGSTMPLNSNKAVFTPKTISKVVPEASTPLPVNMKSDKLAVEAEKVLKELFNS